MNPHRFFMLLSILAVSAGLLAGCGPLPLQPTLQGEGTVTPTATLDPSGYQAVASRGCMVGEWHTLQAERRQGGLTTWLQGNLLAWQPGTSNLAYLAPGERSSWFTGVLMLGEGPDFVEHRQLAPTILVNGDLTWSPSGEWLAFLAFRPNESVYTIMVVNQDGSKLIDLFPADLAPNIALPVIGVLDDAAILWLGSYVFTELCPPEVVAEHMKALSGNTEVSAHDEVVDAETTDVSDKQS